MRHLALAAVLAALAGAPAMAADRTLAGELYYLPRIALPDTAEVSLTARDAAGAVVAGTRMPTGGRQVPLPFALDVPAGVALTLEAALLVSGAPAWAAVPLPVAAGDTDRGLAPIRLDRRLSVERATHLRCGDDEVTFGLTRRGGMLAIAGREVALHIEETASGARFVADGDATTWIWGKGSEWVLSLAGFERLCQAITPPPLFPLLARGHEPGWRLEAAGGRVSFAPAEGTPLEGPVGTALRVEDGERYAIEGDGLAFTVARRICRDSMTGMPHPFAVTVETAAGTHGGCGGAPAALIEGVEWRVTAIEGETLAPAIEVTLHVADGRVAGTSGCNRYGGSVTIGGEGIAFGAMMSTMMACEESRMRIERRFGEALAAVTRFDFAPDGRLVLYAGDRQVLTARRQAPTR